MYFVKHSLGEKRWILTWSVERREEKEEEIEKNMYLSVWVFGWVVCIRVCEFLKNLRPNSKKAQRTTII